jgi:hypothetical protein
MTPPEFNRIGTQVQLDIFEQYFEDLNQQLRVPQSDVDYADRQMALDEKMSPFKTTGVASLNNLPAYWNLPTIDFYGRAVVYNQLAPLTDNQIAFYKLGTVTYKPSVQTPVVLPTELQRLGRAEFYNLQKSDLTVASIYNPVYLYENNKLFVSPALAANTVTVAFLRKPLDIQWAFTTGVGQSYAFNSQLDGGSVNFELSSTEQTNVILKILLYAGIVIRDPQIVQAATRQIQQEEQNKKS